MSSCMHPVIKYQFVNITITPAGAKMNRQKKSYLCTVKKSLHIIGLVSIALLYCFAIGLYSGVAYAGNTSLARQVNAAKESYSNSISAKSFHHTVQTENSVSLVNNARPVSVNNTHNEFSAGIKVPEQLFVHTFTQYSFYSQKLLARLQNTDIIFPFHYFW